MTLRRQVIKTVLDRVGIPRSFAHACLFEAKMILVRIYAVTPFHAATVRRLQQRDPVWLSLGCGYVRHPGWTGVDCVRAASVDLHVDLRRRLPFKDASVDLCHSEHFLEHLYPEEAKKHLVDVHRILKPGGIYRVVVPASIRFAQKYLENDTTFFDLAHPWPSRPIEALYRMVNWEGQHRSIYDFAELCYLGRDAGFAEIRACDANQSPEPALRIDRRDPHRVAESLYVEFTKAPAEPT